MKKIFFIIIPILTLVFFAGCSSENEEATVVEDNTSFEELKVQSNKTYSLKTTKDEDLTLTVENDVLTSDKLKGKIVLINFWATWCPPCKKEIPVFNKLYEKYSDKFEIIGVLYEKNKDEKELADFMKDYKMKFPVTVGEENFRMAKAFEDVKKIPESFLYDAKGNFVKKYLGVVPEDELEAFINKQ